MTAYLLDTHALLWWMDGSQLSAEAMSVLSDETQDVYVSATSVWEVSIKSAKGVLALRPSFLHQLQRDFTLLSVTADHSWEAGQLPRHNGDPFDRMLIAQAMMEGLTLVTRDAAMEAYEVDLLKC